MMRDFLRCMVNGFQLGLGQQGWNFCENQCGVLCQGIHCESYMWSGSL